MTELSSSDKLEIDKMLCEGTYYTMPSKKYCIEIASKIPCSNLQELFDNALKIQEWLKEKF